jgi:hypothetical protein
MEDGIVVVEDGSFSSELEKYPNTMTFSKQMRRMHPLQ